MELIQLLKFFFGGKRELLRDFYLYKNNLKKIRLTVIRNTLNCTCKTLLFVIDIKQYFFM